MHACSQRLLASAAEETNSDAIIEVSIHHTIVNEQYYEHCRESMLMQTLHVNKIILKLNSLRRFPNVVAQCHIFCVVCTQGGYDPQFQTRLRFMYNAPTLKVSSSYVYLLRSYCVDKQTDAAENIQRSSLCYNLFQPLKLFPPTFNMLENIHELQQSLK